MGGRGRLRESVRAKFQFPIFHISECLTSNFHLCTKLCKRGVRKKFQYKKGPFKKKIISKYTHF